MIRLFNKDIDYDKIARWWIDYDQVPCSINLLPNIGFIVDELVVGFLYQTDSSVCFIECVVGNKNANKEERKKALLDLGEMLINTAKEMNFKKVYFHSIHPSVIDTAMKLQFKNTDKSKERFERNL